VEVVVEGEGTEPRYTVDRREYRVAQIVGLTLAGGPGLAILWMVVLSIGGTLLWSNWQRFWLFVGCLVVSLLGQAVEATVKRAKELEEIAYRLSQTLRSYDHRRD
jgi:hypothetical protein